MEKDRLFDQFAAIEDKIQRLLDVCRSQQTAILDLQHKIKQLEEELSAHKEAVKRHTEDKALIRTRIDNLLAKLEEATRA